MTKWNGARPCGTPGTSIRIHVGGEEMRVTLILAALLLCGIAEHSSGQGIASRYSAMLPPDVNQGYGIRGAGGLRANSIAGSGGLRGSSIFGSGGMGGFYSGSRFAGVVGKGLYGGGTPSGMPSAASRGPSAVGVSTSGSKPFSSYSAPPTVSPYMNLFRVDLNGNNNLNYSTLVRPQLQQQQMNQQLEQQNLQNSRRIQSIAAQADYNPQGAKDMYPTGHQTAFSYMGHYYPQTRPRAKRQVAQN